MSFTLGWLPGPTEKVQPFDKLRVSGLLRNFPIEPQYFASEIERTGDQHVAARRQGAQGFLDSGESANGQRGVRREVLGRMGVVTGGGDDCDTGKLA